MKTPAAVDSQTLSARLVSNRHAVLELWEMRVRREVPAARDQSRLSLHDDIPGFLDALALALEGGAPDGAPDGAPFEGDVREVADACEKHGEQRSRNARYTLAQALKEFEILHDVLVEILAAGEPLDLAAHAIVRKAVHEGTQAAGVAFSDAKRNEILSDERDFLNAVLDNLSEGVVACDSRGVITLFNKATREFHGLPESAVPAERWAEHYNLFREDGVTPLPLSEIPLFRALRGEAIRDVEMVIAPVNGKPRAILASGRVLKDPQGATTGAVVAMHDVSVYRAAEETRAALASARAERDAAEKASKVKSAFLANMSHEIRTPLGAILGYAEILLAPQHSASDKSKWTAAILRNAQQLSHLIDEVLDLAKVEAERLEIELLRFELAEVLRDVELVSSVFARGKTVDLRFESDAPAGATLVSDPTRLRQILVNVVGNAIKFTERGHVVVGVRLTRSTVDKERMRLTVSVEDTGIGLSPEQAERIWEPFVQADNSMTRKFGGTGLGLSLSRQLARVLGGDLVLTRSAIAKGSVFTVFIDGGPQEKENIAVKPSQATSKSPSLAGVRILVVDDSSDNQELIRLHLTKQGAFVAVAVDGEDAVLKAQADAYDVLLMDIQMPKLDGYAATSRLRTAGFTGPIIALTAHAMKGERERAMAVGFDEYLAKPIDWARLFETVRQLIK